VPPSAKAIVSAAGKNIPVLVSPELVIEGVDAEPSANSIVCAPLVTTTVPVFAGRVSVVVPDTAGDSIVTEPDVSPLKTNFDII
jgi:hypothetical protein